MTQPENRVAAMTGAASGIGRAPAVNRARRGCGVAQRNPVYPFASDVASRRAGTE